MKRYNARHEGPCLVAGAGPTVREDVARARQLFPDAPLHGANSAGALFPEILHVWTMHAGDAPAIKATADVAIHARSRMFRHRHLTYSLNDEQYAALSYEWPELDTVTEGTSGLIAALWARWCLGHSLVILCGVTLDPEHNVYADGYPWPMRGMDGTVWQDPRGDVFDVWQMQTVTLAKAGRLDGVLAMSGWLGDVLGRP